MTTIEIPPHADIVDRLLKLHEADRLAHAYLFIGQKYTGKSQTAQAVARQISSKIDTHVIECEYGEKIKIDEIRQILGMVKLRPFNAPKKVFIIRDVEQLTIESSNALLKTLEEPSASSVLILTTSVVERLLPTIISRCHRVYFATPSKEYLAEQLQTHYHEDASEAHFLGAFADGSLGAAMKYKEKKLFSAKNQWITEYIFGQQPDDFIKNRLKDKEVTKDFLDVLLSWVRDATLIHVEVPSRSLVHLDRVDELNRFVRQFDFDYLQEVYAEIVQAQKMLAENLNIKLPLLIIKEKLSWGR